MKTDKNILIAFLLNIMFSMFEIVGGLITGSIAIVSDAIHDFGDAIRSGAATTYEDDPNLENVGINMEYFRKFTEAYLSETKEILTQQEIDNLALSCRIITLELAMRFLNDYINGDTYFKCDYEKHNLVRARNQIKLVDEMEKHYQEMNKIIKECALNKVLKLTK